MTTPATRADALAERKAKANARIAELERQAGIALIDGKDVAATWQGKIEAQRRELIAAEAAETELVTRQREAAAAEHAARVKALRDNFREQETQRLAAVARAHAAANQLVSALHDALRASEDMRQCCQHLGKAPPVQLSDFDDRLSGLLSGLLATLSGKRATALPNIPTADEQGMKDFDVSAWNALFMPKGTPPAIVAKLNAAVGKVLDTPAVQKRLDDIGLIATPPDRRTPEYLGRFVASEIEKWEAPARASGAAAN